MVIVLCSVLCVVTFDLVDEKKVCDLLEEGNGGIQDAGWETYWGKEEDMKMTMKSTYFCTLKLDEPTEV